VLLAGTDRRFLRVTSFLLSRRGYEVLTSPPAQAAETAAHHRADVVLLEGVLSRVAAARRVAEIRALAAAPGVVVVTEGSRGFWSGLSTVEKWTALEDLVDEIETVSLQRRRSFP
jgi:DNA-binding response OmpR family regulator